MISSDPYNAIFLLTTLYFILHEECETEVRNGLSGLPQGLMSELHIINVALYTPKLRYNTIDREEKDQKRMLQYF